MKNHYYDDEILNCGYVCQHIQKNSDYERGKKAFVIILAVIAACLIGVDLYV